MFRIKYIVAIIAVVLVGFGLKNMVAPRATLAAPEPNSVAMSVYDLQVGHPNMNSLPVQEAPLP
jgi:hypothetical protein